MDRCSSNFKNAINERADEGNRNDDICKNRRLLLEDEILVNAKDKNVEGDDSTAEDVTTPQPEEAVNKTYAGYYEGSSDLYDYYGVFLTNEQMIIDVRYKVVSNIKEKKYVYKVILYNDSIY